MTDTVARGQRRGFSFVEVIVAVGLMALCLVPMLDLSTSTVRETAVSREDVLARHLLMDLVERYRASTIGELEQLPQSSSLAGVAAGQDDVEVARDDLLKERTARLLVLLGAAARGGKSDGLDTYRALHRSMAVSRQASFEKDKLGAGRHVLTCAVRWRSKSGKDKRIEFSRLVIGS